MTENQALQIIHQFAITGQPTAAAPYGNGHINDTFLVTTAADNDPDYILQRINHHVFKNVPALMNNIALVTKHIQKKIAAAPPSTLRCLTLIPTQAGDTFLKDSDGSYWRTYIFIANSRTHDLITDPKLGVAGGQAFGEFQRHLSDIDVTQLSETIVNFHHLGKRLDTFEQILKTDPYHRAQYATADIDYIQTHAARMLKTLELGQAGQIPLRVTHNDTKFNNVLFSPNGEAVCVIDLDTVMPGYVQYDFSDAVRTCTNTAVEDEPNLSKVDINIPMFAALSRGFLSAAGSALTDTEINLMAPAANLLPFMIGLRFLTDFLDNDQYFKINRDNHNLERARTQLTLSQAIDREQQQLNDIINQLKQEMLQHVN